MRQRSRSTAIALSLRSVVQRVLFSTLLLLSLFLIYSEYQRQPFVKELHAKLLAVVQPTIQWLSSPMKAVSQIQYNWQTHWQVHAENEQLRLENARLKQWKQQALMLSSENAGLRELLNYSPPMTTKPRAAKILASLPWMFSHRLLVNAGADAGVVKGQAVGTVDGLIGRVTHVNAQTSDILLLTDVSSRIPVRLEPSGQRALLVGDHDNMPYLKFADPKTKPELGQTVLTSGDGKVMPDQLVIGKVFASREGQWRVRLSQQPSQANYVFLYHTSGQSDSLNP